MRFLLFCYMTCFLDYEIISNSFTMIAGVFGKRLRIASAISVGNMIVYVKQKIAGNLIPDSDRRVSQSAGGDVSSQSAAADGVDTHGLSAESEDTDGQSAHRQRPCCDAAHGCQKTQRRAAQRQDTQRNCAEGEKTERDGALSLRLPERYRLRR